MTKLNVSENNFNKQNLLYLQGALAELFAHTECNVKENLDGKRAVLSINFPEYYSDIIKMEIKDKISEVVAIKYKYEFFKSSIKVMGLSKNEYEILMASLIAADLEEDKKYCFERLNSLDEIAVDGVYNFRLQLLRKKWSDIVSYIPPCFVNSQLKDFITFLLENKKKKVYIDDGKVYDSHYRRLKRVSLLDGEQLKIVREVLLSNCGSIEINGNIPKDDEFYLKEYYGDKINFSSAFYC